MAEPVYWDDAYAIALLLNVSHVDVADPSTLSLNTLRDWVLTLTGFADDRDAMPIESLEQIQAEWVELK